jgi:hypothetical protein
MTPDTAALALLAGLGLILASVHAFGRHRTDTTPQGVLTRHGSQKRRKTDGTQGR